MRQIQIEWFDTHHAQDNIADLRNGLEAGGDEGPLLVVPFRPKARTPQTRGRHPTMFTNIDDYIAHLAAHSTTADGDRWAGLVRGVPQSDRALALGVLERVKNLIAPHAPRPQRGPSRQARPPADDYAVLTGPHPLTENVELENIGEGFTDITTAFPALTQNMHFTADAQTS